MTQYKVKDRVMVHLLGYGWVASAWKDERGEDLYNVLLENGKATPTGYVLARNCELTTLWN
jgi:hypothetical protein